MAWKQDLAKLKQQLGPEPPGPKPPPPKAAPKPEGPTSLVDEDAVFLSAMGLKPAAPRPPKAPLLTEPPGEQPTLKPPPAESFEEAIKELKGLKPLAKGLSDPPPSPPPHAPPAGAAKIAREGSEPPLAPAQVEPSPAEEPVRLAPPPQRVMPLRFQLAAGMALEVDGTLDLRGHSLADAIERLKDRLGDGSVLGWRSLQVTLGPNPILHEGLLELLASGEVPMVARFAQAPIPMGGNQAWLLYFGPPPTLS